MMLFYSLMYFTASNISALDRITRLNLINSITGIKPANLIGSQSNAGDTNLAVFSSVVHLGSNPALLGFILRPQGEVRRHTYENIMETGVYTINAVSNNLAKQAHYTSAKFPAELCEFEKSGLTKEYIAGFTAPFVSESPIKIGLKFLEEIAIKANNTQLIVGEVQHLIIPSPSQDLDGHLNLENLQLTGISGLNSYYQLTKIAQYPYVREYFSVDDLENIA